MCFNRLPPELQDYVLDFYLCLNPDARRDITSLSKHLRMRLRHHRITSLEIFASEPFLPPSIRRPTVVLPHQLPQFLADAQEFEAVFSGVPCVAFGEIENLKINLPFDEDNRIAPLKRMLSCYRRPINLVKISSWQDRMDLADFMADVGTLGEAMPGIRTLALVFEHFGGQEDDSDGDGDVLPNWELWHETLFFDNVKVFANLVCLKLRTALEVFPVVTEHDQRSACVVEDSWIKRLGQAIPTLRRIHISHSYSEQLGHEGSMWYSGERIVRYRDSVVEDWSSGCWFFPSPNLEDPLHLRQKRSLRNPRTTEKIHFDAWGSDGEYEECQEDGW